MGSNSPLPINEGQLQEVVERLREEPELLRAVHRGVTSIPSRHDFSSPAGSDMAHKDYAQRRCQKYIVRCPTCTCRHAQPSNNKEQRASVPLRPDAPVDPDQPLTSGTVPGGGSSSGQSGRGKKKLIGAGAGKKKQDRRWNHCFARMDAHSDKFSANIPSQAEIAAHFNAADDFEAADVAVIDDDETHDFSSSPTHEAMSFWDGEDMQQP